MHLLNLFIWEFISCYDFLLAYFDKKLELYIKIWLYVDAYLWIYCIVWEVGSGLEALSLESVSEEHVSKETEGKKQRRKLRRFLALVHRKDV